MDSIVVVVVVVVARHESRPGTAQVRLDENTLVPSTTCPHVSPFSLILPFATHKAPSVGRPHSR
jgi:hypothetical protein